MRGEHPLLVAVLVGGALLGALAGVLLLGPEWSLARRLIGGAAADFGVGLLVTATRIVG
ncbi:MAG: hypothetical protein ACE5FG_10115 [Myxococcota bacterium]